VDDLDTSVVQVGRRLKKSVGKIFANRKEADKERETNAQLASVDPGGAFTVPVSRQCKVREVDRVKKALQQCPRDMQTKLRENLRRGELEQLVMMDAGIDLSKLTPQAVKDAGRLPVDVLFALSRSCTTMESRTWTSKRPTSCTIWRTTI
jgi:hypothetical protein